MAPPLKKRRRFSGDNAPPHHEPERVSQDQTPNDPSKPADKPEQQRRSLFVRALPASTTSESLTELFSQSYPIKHATAVTDPETKQCRGYGFVNFADAEDAQRAKEEFNGHLLDGRKLRVEIAEPRHRDAERGGAEDGQRKRGHAPAPPQPTKLIVRNLPWSVKSSEQLSKLFMSYGKVKEAYIPRRSGGQMTGFGFVVMRGRKNAEKALEGINGKELDGRTLAVDWAVNKEDYDKMLNGSNGGTGKAGEEAARGSDNGSDEAVEDDLEANTEAVDIDEEADLENSELAAHDDDDSEDVDIQMEGDHDDEDMSNQTEDRSSTVFVRNLPFTCTDEDLEDHFAAFGNTRYARVVMDPNTERSRGTGFVCFYNGIDAQACVRDAPARAMASTRDDELGGSGVQPANSILQNEEADPTGKYTMDGRVLQVSKALDKSEATRLTQEGAASRRKRNEDKRRLYLLHEGTISSKSKLYDKLSPSERTMREGSAKQRRNLIESNPSLHLSLTRLSIRNLPRSVGSKELKSLAREAVVGFATDAKEGRRERLSKEELARGGEDMEAAEKARKKSGKGVVKQAKVVFEGAGGSKVSEDSGAGRSRGYGFVEYHTHRSALMGLRWLNGHAVDYQVRDAQNAKASKEDVQDRKKRLIVEFAIENAQVVMRRRDREQKTRDRSEAVKQGLVGLDASGDPIHRDADGRPSDSKKRKRGFDKPNDSKGKKHRKGANVVPKTKGNDQQKTTQSRRQPIDEKLARRNQIIGRKRAMRRVRKGGKP